MKCRLFSCINTKMFFKLVGFQEPRASMSIGSGGRFLFWPVRDAVCANKPPGRAAQKLVTRHNKRTRPVRVGEHRFEDCSPCL